MKKRWMALLGAAVVTINLFAGCGSTGAEQAITQMVRRQRQYREKTAPEAGMRRRAWQEAQIRSSWR